VENSLPLTEHPQELAHHLLWPAHLGLFSLPVRGSSSAIEWSRKPLLSSCTLSKGPANLKSLPSLPHWIAAFSILPASKVEGKERENLFQEVRFREHSNRLSTSASGWAL